MNPSQSPEATALAPARVHPSSFPSSRLHIFLQKRVRANDTTMPWLYPCKTDGGQMRADRIAFPVPPGVHWREVEAVEVPEVELTTEAQSHGEEEGGCHGMVAVSGAAAEHGKDAVAPEKASRRVWPRGIEERDEELYRGKKRLMTVAMIQREQGVTDSGMWFVPEGVEVVRAMPEPTVVKATTTRKPRAKKAKVAKVRTTVDPAFIALSRELRDRWMERVEEEPWLIAASVAKHDVRRAISPRQREMKALPSVEVRELKSLPMAA